MYDLVVVFMENKSGKLAKVTDVLAKNGINILYVDIADDGQFGLLTILTDEPIKAREVLYDANFTVALEKNVVVEIDDKVGSFAGLCKILDEEGVNVSEASGCVVNKGEKAIFCIKTDDPEKLDKILEEREVKTISEL